jgi:ATP-dependent Zn protease
MTDGPPREWVAYEEASHAVALWALKHGKKIKLATIKPRHGSWGSVERRKIMRKGDAKYSASPAAMARIESEIIVHLAGQYGPNRIAPERRENHDTADYDLVNEVIFHRLYPRLHDHDLTGPRYLSYMEARAERLVWQYWKEIEAVAMALLEHETLTGDQILAVIYEVNGLPSSST